MPDKEEIAAKIKVIAPDDAEVEITDDGIRVIVDDDDFLQEIGGAVELTDGSHSDRGFITGHDTQTPYIDLTLPEDLTDTARLLDRMAETDFALEAERVARRFGDSGGMTR